MSLRRASAFAAAAFSLALAQAACGGAGRDAGANGAKNASNAGAAAANATPVAVGDLNAEIERLERSAERNPSDDTVREALAVAYVRRGNAARAAGDLRAALKDYRSALRFDEDNDEAQNASAELSVQVEGEKTGEYGEPAPLPITPGVTADDDAGSTAPTPQPSATPRKRP